MEAQALDESNHVVQSVLDQGQLYQENTEGHVEGQETQMYQENIEEQQNQIYQENADGQETQIYHENAEQETQIYHENTEQETQVYQESAESQETQMYQENAEGQGNQIYQQNAGGQEYQLLEYQLGEYQTYEPHVGGEANQQNAEHTEGEENQIYQEIAEGHLEGEQNQISEENAGHVEGEESQMYQEIAESQANQMYQENAEGHIEEQEDQMYHEITEGHVVGQENQAYQENVEGHVEGQENQMYLENVEGHVEGLENQVYQETAEGQGQIYQESAEGQETQIYHENAEGQETQIYQENTEGQETQIYQENAEGQDTQVYQENAEGHEYQLEEYQQEFALPSGGTTQAYEEHVQGQENQMYQENAEEHDTSGFLNIQEAIFNPNTGTLEPITTTPKTSTVSTPSKSKAGRNLKRTATRIQKRGKVQNQQVKFVIPGEAGQQIVLDAQTLQGLLQGGGNTITLSGTSGKQQIIVSTSSPQKNRTSGTTRSPAKILPAPVPVGDQQQPLNSTSAKPKYMLKQGNVLTPISSAVRQSLGSPTKVYQVQGNSGSNSNQVQYVRLVSNKQIPSNKVPIPPARPKPVAPRPPPGGQTIFSLPSGSSNDMTSLQGTGMGNFVVLPSSYVVKSEPNTPVPIRPAEMTSSSSSMSSYNGLLDSTSSILGGFGQSLSGQSSGNYESFRSLLEPNGMRPRKPCNCTKSQCLKLYCDCFANGEFCHLCNCNNCYNNLNHEEDRQKAIKLVLERNPGAFRPKIGKSSQTGEAHERRHNKGCNCRRSGCLKNYCECYEAKIFCSGICKCTGCKNCIENIPSGLPNDVGVEQHFAGAGTSHRQTLKDLAEAAEVRVQQQTQVRNKMKAQMQDVSPQNNLGNMVPPVIFRYPHGSISYEVVTSIVELLLAKTEVGERQKLNEGDLEKLVLEEFSECLESVMELGTTVGHLDD